MGKLVSTVECARRNGVSRQAVHAAVRRGDISAERVGRDWVITEEACEAWASSPAQSRRRRLDPSPEAATGP